jgi:tRNA A37 threonylcarbamoyladenosine synthetase subunit TsaC/SUA5/YrdC
MRIYRFNQLSQLCFELNNAKAIIVPTDTVMGIISKVPSLIYEIKNRPHYKKLILFVGNIDSVKGLTKLEKNILKKY